MRAVVVCMILLLGLAWGQDEPLRTVADSVRLAAVSDDRAWLAWNGDGDLQIWDFAKAVPVARWVEEGTPVWLRLAPNRHGLLVGMKEKRVDGFSLDGHKLWSVGVDDTPKPASFSADGTLAGFPTLGGTALTVIDTATGKPIRTIQSHTRVEDWAWSSTGLLAVAWADKTLEIFNQDASQLQEELSRHGELHKLAWSPNGRRLLLSEGDLTLLLAAADWSETLRFDLPHWRIRPAMWSPGGGHFALTHFKAPTRYCNSLRELPSGRAMRLDDTSEKAQVDFSPDDHLMAITTDKVRVYRLVDGDERFTSPDVQPRQAWFAPTGHRMMVWTWNGALRIWDF